ncbi:hypothetical protein Droror1_Dr00012143 [Drosera rotundifolia]
MAWTGETMRRSIHTFLKHYQYFTLVSSFIAFPFSISLLISQALIQHHSFPFFPMIYARVRAIFHAAGFPASSDFFALVGLKLSQTISSSAVTIPFTLSLLLLAKASVIRHLDHTKQRRSSLISLYNPLLVTQIFGFFLVISANATSFSILFLGFTSLEGLSISSPNRVLFLSSLGAVFYSILLANTIVICNLASTIAAIEKGEGVGFTSIFKACVLIKGRVSMALALVVQVNLGLAAVEALFQFRIVRSYYVGDRTLSSLSIEGTLIAYMYSVMVVIDSIVGYVFYRSCKDSNEDEFYASDVEKQRAIENFL